MTQRRFEMVPRGPFDLDNQASQFGGWPRLGDGILMAFPVEGWNSSAAVVMRQHGQTRRIRQRMAEEAGGTIDVDGAAFKAFPAHGCGRFLSRRRSTNCARCRESASSSPRAF